MSVIGIKKDSFETEVIKSDRPTVVEFTAPWCVYCRRLEPVLDRLAVKMGDEIHIGKIDIDDEPELAERYGVSVIPTLYLFRNGEHGDKLVAPSSQAQVEEWIKEQIRQEGTV